MTKKPRLRQRLPLGQIGLFLAIALVCTAYVAIEAVGADTVAPKNHYTVLMTDAGGVSPRSPVSYRGVIVGTVDDVVAQPDGIIKVDMTILERVKIPRDTDIVVAQDTPVALKHIDIRPEREEGPYLRNGEQVGPKRTARPLALEELLVNLMKFTDDLDMKDVSTIASELSEGLGGTAPHLERLADNTFALVDRFVELKPTAKRLIANSKEFMEATGGSSGRLPRIAKSLARVTDQLRRVTPDGVKLARKVAPLAARIIPLLRANEPAMSVIMANAVTPAQIVAARIPALRHGLVTIPKGFSDLASIGTGDTANFDFVMTSGPVCYYENKRRTPQDTSPREPKLTYHCDSDLPVRGAANAPRPAGATERRPVVTMSDPATGRTAIPNSQPVYLGANGGQASVLGNQSWQAIYLQAVQ